MHYFDPLKKNNVLTLSISLIIIDLDLKGDKLFKNTKRKCTKMVSSTSLMVRVAYTEYLLKGQFPITPSSQRDNRKYKEFQPSSCCFLIWRE